jgi:C1A family cysteine protease
MRSIFYSGLTLLGMSRFDLSLNGDSMLRFENYVQKFNKTYANDAERKHRFMAFLESEEEIAQLNSLENEEIFGWTIFSDMTKEEFSKRLNFIPYNKQRRYSLFGEIPVYKSKKNLTTSSLDWRTKNAVTPVKDQGNCGSCWAFSAVQTVESAYLLKNTKTNATDFLLSEQELVSCDKQDGGCLGGDIYSAFQFLQWSGLTTEEKYPYTSGKDGDSGTCLSFSPLTGTKPTEYIYATPECYDHCDNQDEGTLAINMADVGPVGICVNAEKWQNYKGGIMSKSSCGSHRFRNLDHCVQLVGFKSIDSSNGYWIVKNSWTADWGEDGYIYLSYGFNTCGLADEAMFVIL